MRVGHFLPGARHHHFPAGGPRHFGGRFAGAGLRGALPAPAPTRGSEPGFRAAAMSEIKFACPHCGQHIACDRDYVDMCIVCPTCGKPMEVPRLSAAEASHPDMCVVASIPQPRQRFISRIPTIDLWKEEEWEERYRAAVTPAQQTPLWLLSAMGTVIAAALLKATMMPAWAVILCLLA